MRLRRDAAVKFPAGPAVSLEDSLCRVIEYRRLVPQSNRYPQHAHVMQESSKNRIQRPNRQIGIVAG